MQGITQPGVNILLCVHHIAIERPMKAIHERRHIKRSNTAGITPLFDDALPEERRAMLVVVDVL